MLGCLNVDETEEAEPARITQALSLKATITEILEIARDSAGSHEIRFNPETDKYATIPNYGSVLCVSRISVRSLV